MIYSREYRTPERMTDNDDILAANTAFYAAFAAGDAAAMAQVWADDDTVSCIHPGWPAIAGRAAVLGSWRDILRNSDRPHVVCREPHPLITGDHGRVLCVEVVGSIILAASNQFRRIDGTWRLVHHQSSQIVRVQEQMPRDTTTPSKTVH